jgi:hypothetical protein
MQQQPPSKQLEACGGIREHLSVDRSVSLQQAHVKLGFGNINAEYQSRHRSTSKVSL